ncbi:MAG TPA: glutamate ABC transporter substrate-binding protein [Chloroflexota bacterium]|nr:glutamate ABC transporter substrate-binding protein [Chloroflexota bacterium]
MSRRQFIAALGGIAGSVLLAACARPAGNPAPSAPRAGATPAPAALPAFPRDSYMRTIQDRGALRAGTNYDAQLFGFLNPGTGQPEGFDVDICRLIAKGLFGDPDRVEFLNVTTAIRMAFVEQNLGDVVAATMTITKKRAEEVDFSDVYYESAQMILVPKGSPIADIQDTANRRVCAAKGSTSIDNLRQLQPLAIPDAPVGWVDCLHDVQQKKADAISTDDTILMGLAAEAKAQNFPMVLLNKRLSYEPYGVAIKKGRAGFVPFVNQVLANAKQNGEWAKVFQRWLGEYLPTPPPPTKTATEAAV